MSELGKALHGFQQDAPPIHLDGTGNFNNKFASLGSVVAAVRPVLNKHGLVYAQLPTNIDGAPALETMLIHAESGEDIAAVTPLILGKNDPQGYGSALTYARRYALLSILGLVGDEDDDANAAQPAQNGHSVAAPGDASDAQKRMIRGLAKKLNLEPGNVDALTKAQASARITELKAAEEATKDAVAVGGGASDIDDIPFGPSLA